VLAVDRVLEAFRADVDWVASAVTNAQREKLDGSRPLTHEERGRARDQQLESHASLRRQRAHDARSADLDAMRRRT
jgi:hypothetical protein